MRSAQQQASGAYGQAKDTANTLSGEAQGIGANLTPFLTEEMLHPQGYGQQDMSAMTSAALAGAGGANAGLEGVAAQRAAASRNAGGFGAALESAARQRDKAAAGASENLGAENARLKQQQMQEGAQGLEHQYGTDTSGMLSAMGQEAPDINAEMNASKYGWLQQAQSIMAQLASGGKNYIPPQSS